MPWRAGVVACALACAGALMMLSTPALAAPGVRVVSPRDTTTVNVAITNAGFDPPTLAVPVGTVVVWTNKASGPRTVTAVDGSFASDDLVPGATFPFQFAQVGTFQYRDIHTTAMGVITVVPGSLQSASTPNATTPAPPTTGAGNPTGVPTMAFTGTNDWVLGALGALLLALGRSLVRRRPAVEPFRVDRHTARVIERARRREELLAPWLQRLRD